MAAAKAVAVAAAKSAGVTVPTTTNTNKVGTASAAAPVNGSTGGAGAAMTDSVPDASASAAAAAAAADGGDNSVDAYLATLMATVSDRERADIAAANALKAVPAAQLAQHGNANAGAGAAAAADAAAKSGDASASSAAASMSTGAGAGSGAGSAGAIGRVFDDEEELDEADYAGGDTTVAAAQRAFAATIAARAQKLIKPYAPPAEGERPVVKALYREHPDVAALSDAEVAAARKGRLDSVRLRGLRIPRPVSKWIHCGFPAKVDAVLAA